MASPIDVFGGQTMDFASQFGAQTEPGAAAPVGGDVTAGGGFNPINNTQLESLFPTSNAIPVDPGPVGGRPEGGLFGNPIPVDPGPVGGRPEGGLFGNPVPIDPGPAGGLPEGGFFNQGPVGPVVTGTPPPENPFGNNPNPLNLPGLPPDFVNPGTPGGPPIPVDPGPVNGQPEGGLGGGLTGPDAANLIRQVGAGGTGNATLGGGAGQLPPDFIQRLLAILAARQNRTA